MKLQFDIQREFKVGTETAIYRLKLIKTTQNERENEISKDSLDEEIKNNENFILDKKLPWLIRRRFS